MKRRLLNLSPKKRRTLILGALIALFILFWLGGVFAQSTSMEIWQSGEKVRFDPISCIAANFKYGFHGIVCVLIMYSFLAAYWSLHIKDRTNRKIKPDSRGFHIEESGVFGTSELLSAEKVKNFAEVETLERTQGIILGRFGNDANDGKKNKQIVSIPPDGCHYKYDSLGRIALQRNQDGTVKPVRERIKVNGNRHMMITGASGCGKSYCFSRPAIFQSILAGESIVVTDPKGELYSDTAMYAASHGYTVKIFNLSYPQGSDSWDALAELKGSPQIGIEAQNFCNIIISNTTNPYSKSDHFYDDGEKNLLTALVLYVLDAPCYTGPRTLGGVYELLCKKDEELFPMFEALPEGHCALASWGVFKSASPGVRGNLMLGLGGRLQVLQDEIIKIITGTPDINLVLPGKSPCAYYIIMPDMNSTYTFLSSLFFSCFFNKLVEFSRKQLSQRLPVSVNVIMDEFIAIGKLPDFDKKLATVRSAGINIYMIFQNLAQLQAAYPNGLWETLIGNCYTFLCLSCNDMTTAQYLSKRSGITTVALENQKIDRPFLEFASIPKTVSHTYSVGQRAVIQEAEVIKASAENKLIVSIAGADLFMLDKFPYTDLVDPAKLTKVNAYEHSPSWAYQYGISYAYSSSQQVGFTNYKPKFQQIEPEEPPSAASEENKPEEEKTNKRIATVNQTKSNIIDQKSKDAIESF